MDERHLRVLLQQLKTDAVDIDAVVERLRAMPVQDLGFARLDTHRELRQGFAEVVYAESKTPQQVATIMQRLCEHHERVMATRATPAHFSAVAALLPQAVYHEVARIIAVAPDQATCPLAQPAVAVVCAGTSDLPVAEEAAVTLETMGRAVLRRNDIGVSGLHRLLDALPELQAAPLIIAVAGMEGALPGVLAGLVRAPVVAVPTSVGYGAAFGGIAPLLTMLNSCASGLAVVNIDNGFGAAHLAARILAMGKG
jgi:NCAIR mutase (PurE)-related protein